MRLLALDSATAACSVALWDEGMVTARRFAAMTRGQAEALLPMVAEVMAEAGLGFADLDLLAATVGPGAFTGIRIGLAAVRGLGLAAGLPVAGVLTTEAVAAAVPAAERRGRTLMVALDSKRDDLWVQIFDAGGIALGPPAALAADAAAALVAGPLALAGDAAPVIAGLRPDALVCTSPGWPDAAVVAGLAARCWAEGRALPPEPVYLRPADVTLPP